MSLREELNEQARELAEWYVAELRRLLDQMRDKIGDRDVYVFQEAEEEEEAE